MKRAELDYRKPRNDAFFQGNRAPLPKHRGSMNHDVETLVLTLYTGGRSVESITREVGRARHLVVHILQAKGVFGTHRPEPAPEMPGTDFSPSRLTEAGPTEPREKIEPAAVNETRGEAAIEARSSKSRLRKKPKAAENGTSEGSERSLPEVPPVGKPRRKSEWSPLVVDALLKVIAEPDLNLGMTIEEARQVVSRSHR